MKKVISWFLVMTLMLSMFAVPAYATGSEDIKADIVLTEGTHNGRNGLFVEFGIQTGTTGISAIAYAIAYDPAILELVDASGTSVTVPTSDYSLVKESMIEHNLAGFDAAFSNVYLLGIGSAVGMVFFRGSMTDMPFATWTLLDKCFLAYRTGKDASDITKGAIRMATAAEADKLGQSSVVFATCGTDNYGVGFCDGTADTAGWEANLSFGKDFTFAQPAASVGTAPAAKPDLKYNGGEQNLVTAGTATNGTMQYSLNGTTWTDTVPKGTDAKTYTVYYKVKGDSGYSDYTPSPNTVTVKIEPKSIADSTVTIDPIPDQTYTGNAIEPPLVVKDGGTTLTKGTDYTVSYPINNTNAGLASLQVNGMGNYTGTKGESFNIDRADQVLTVPGTAYVAFNKTLDLNTICSSNAFGATLTFAKVTTSSLPSGTTFDESTGIVTAGNNTGSFIVTVDSAAVTNYNAALQKQITVCIVTTPAASVTAAPTAKTGLTYNGNDQALVSDGTANGGTMQYSLNGTNWTDTVPKGKNAGNYTVYYKVKGDSDHTDYTPTSNTVSVTIAQKEVTVAPGTYKVSKEYNGTTAAGTGSGALSVTGIVDSGARVKATPVAYTDANVGGQSTMNVTINLDGTGNGNYKIKDGATTISVPCEITAKDVKLTGGINATDRSYVKDNKTVALTKGTLAFDGLVGSETLDVNIPATGTISDAKVGTYNVTYSGVTLKDGTGTASNYKLVSPLPTVTVNITKATAPTLTNIPVSQKYTVTTGEKAIGAVMPADAGTLTYTKGTASKNGSVTVTSWNVDTTGKVTYTLSGGAAGDTVTLPVIISSDNYANATVNVVITLTVKDDQAALTLTGGTTVVYGETLQLGTTGGSGTGAVTYAVTNGTGEATIDATGKLTPTKAGTVTVTATKAADANYNSRTSAPVTITITKATPTGAPGYTAITAEGKTLADAGLNVGTIIPAGTIKWVDLPTTTVEANKSYSWVFTPTDTDNYETLTGSIQLWHKSTGGRYYYSSSNSSGTATITAVLTAKDAKSATDYTSGIYGLTFRSTADFSGFKGVKVDGKTIGKDNYVAESNNGSIEVYLKAAYLKTLAVGRHTLTIMATGGNASIDFTIGGVNTAPKTFDAGIAVYVTMAVASVTGMAWMGKKRED